MTLARPSIVALDSSQWVKWLDDALRPGRLRRREALSFHRRLVAEGVVPLLSWHHLEEIVAIADPALAADRVAFIADLPLLAWLRLGHDAGPGAITEIVAAEARAALEGFAEPAAVRKRAKALLLRSGTGAQLLGEDLWIWDVVRVETLRRREKHMLMAAVRPLALFDQERAVGEIAAGSIREPGEAARTLARHRSSLGHVIAAHGDKRIADPRAMAAAFYADVAALAPPAGSGVRQLLVATLCAQGLDPEEVRDDAVLADLTELAAFRNRLRVVERLTGAAFERLKTLQPHSFPHWLVEKALHTHGQKRGRRPGSDVNDGHLATLAAYCDLTYVDKRTAEDVRRALARSPHLRALLSPVAKAGDYEAVLFAQQPIRPAEPNGSGKSV